MKNSDLVLGFLREAEVYRVQKTKIDNIFIKRKDYSQDSITIDGVTIEDRDTVDQILDLLSTLRRRCVVQMEGLYREVP